RGDGHLAESEVEHAGLGGGARTALKTKRAASPAARLSETGRAARQCFSLASTSMVRAATCAGGTCCAGAAAGGDCAGA
ncbi:MAG: hypothetical protein RL458_1394, partial [Pseudomonadota bacterium]